jgi:hypothetical protein
MFNNSSDMHSGAALGNPSGPGLLPNGNPFLQGTASQPIEEHDEGIVGNTPVNYE